MNSDTNLNNQIGQDSSNGMNTVPNLSNVQPVMDSGVSTNNVNTVPMGEVNNAGIAGGVNSVDNLTNVQPVMDNVIPTDNTNAVPMGEVNNADISSGVNSSSNLTNVQPVMDNVIPTDNINTVSVGEVNSAGIAGGVNSVDNLTNIQSIMDNNVGSVASTDGVNTSSSNLNNVTPVMDNNMSVSNNEVTDAVVDNNLNFQNDPLINIQQNLDAVPSNSEITSVPSEGLNDADLQKPKKKSKGLIILIFVIIALLVVLFVAYKFFVGGSSNGSSSGLENGATINQTQDLKISNDYSKLVIRVDEVERDVTIASNNFTKIKISVHNYDKKKSNPSYINFNTVDKDGNATSTGGCYDSVMGDTYGGMSDAIDMSIPGGERSTGYLYCDDADSSADKLRIISYTSFDDEGAKDGELRSTNQEVFYISLN